jgi:hypothetical protein
MLRLILKATALLALAAPALGLAGCSDSLSANDTSFAKVNQDYKNALSSRDKKAAIAELKKDQQAAQQAAGVEVETTASTKPAKKKKQAEAPAEAAQN